MVKLLSAIGSGILGLGLAFFAAWGVYTSNTAAPSHNPASSNSVNYGK